MTILMLNAPPSSGKDTAANILREHGYAVYSIADPLKQMVLLIYGLRGYRPEHLDAVKDKTDDCLHGKTLRELYISHGQHMKRLHGDDFWIKQTVAKIKQHLVRYPSASIVITDVGFPVELNTIVNNFSDCKLIKLHRDWCNYSTDSRSDLPEIVETIHIDNNGTIDDLRMRLVALFCRDTLPC